MEAALANIDSTRVSKECRSRAKRLLRAVAVFDYLHVFDDDGDVSLHWSDRGICCDVLDRTTWSHGYCIYDARYGAQPNFRDSEEDAYTTLVALLKRE